MGERRLLMSLQVLQVAAAEIRIAAAELIIFP